MKKGPNGYLGHLLLLRDRTLEEKPRQLALCMFQVTLDTLDMSAKTTHSLKVAIMFHLAPF